MMFKERLQEMLGEYHRLQKDVMEALADIDLEETGHVGKVVYPLIAVLDDSPSPALLGVSARGVFHCLPPAFDAETVIGTGDLDEEDVVLSLPVNIGEGSPVCSLLKLYACREDVVFPEYEPACIKEEGMEYLAWVEEQYDEFSSRLRVVARDLASPLLFRLMYALNRDDMDWHGLRGHPEVGYQNDMLFHHTTIQAVNMLLAESEQRLVELMEAEADD